jgi:hypothetical protein
MDVEIRLVREGPAWETHNDEMDCRVGKDYTEQSPCKGQEKSLGKELAEKTACAGADGCAHRKLVLPRRSAGEQKNGDIGTADEQQQEDSPKEEKQGLSYLHVCKV